MPHTPFWLGTQLKFLLNKFKTENFFEAIFSDALDVFTLAFERNFFSLFRAYRSLLKTEAC
jgi:hypothetical protein